MAIPNKPPDAPSVVGTYKPEMETGYPSGEDISASAQATALITAEFNRIAYNNGRSGTDVSVAKHMGVDLNIAPFPTLPWSTTAIR